MNLHIFLKIIFISAFLCCYSNSHAQYFERVYGGNNQTTGNYFTINKKHEIVLVGNYQDTINNSSGYYLLNIDTIGNVNWQKNISDAFDAYGISIATLNDGRIITLGTHSGAIYQALAEVQLLDSTGNVLIASVYPPIDGWGTAGTSLCSSGDSSMLIAFYTDGFISTNYYSVYKLNANLQTEWSDFVSFDGSLTNQNGLVSSPTEESFTMAFYEIYIYSPTLLFNISHIRKHDSNGVLISDSLYSFNCISKAISPAFDKGAVICGLHDTLNRMNLDLIRIDSLGNEILHRKYTGRFNTEAVDVIQTPDSGFVILSTINDSIISGLHDIQILKTNSLGDSLWSRQFGGYLDEQAIKIECDGNDLVIMSHTSSFGTNHIYIIRTDSAGIIQSPYSIMSGGRYFCANDSATLSIFPPPRPGVQITWSTGDTINPIQVTASGNYFATLTDTSGNATQTSFFPVYFAAQPNADFGPDTIRICNGLPLLNSGTDLANSYQWYFNNTILPGETTSSIVPQQPGNYQLVVSNYCASDTSSSFVDTLYSPPAQPVITSAPFDHVCVGDSLLLSISPGLNESLQWFTTDFINQYPIPGAIDSSLYVYQNGVYWVSSTNIHGCSNSSSPKIVLYDLNGEFINPNGPPSFCQGGQVELTISPGSGYLWSNGDTTQTTIVDSSGQYFVSLVNQYGCPKNSDTITITVLNNPDVNLGNDTLVCLGSTITLDAGPGFNNYFWNDESTLQTLDVSVSGTLNDTGFYFISVTDTNGCTDGDTVRIIFDVCSGLNVITCQPFYIYPNPSKKEESVIIKGEMGEKYDLIIYQAGGKEMLKKSFESFIELKNSTFLSSGLFFYRIFSGKKVWYSGLLIIE